MRRLLSMVVAVAVGVVLCNSVAAMQSGQKQQPKPAPRGDTPKLPQLGDPVPDTLLKRATPAHPCDTGEGRHEPCTTLNMGHNRIIVAWDATTLRVTYLYSTTIEMDSDIRVGDLLQIDPDSPVTPFSGGAVAHRFVSADWCDTNKELTGETQWCAVMVPVRPKSGKVLGFVQSLYLDLDDPGAYLKKTRWVHP